MHTKESKWSSKGGGLKKHRSSGVSHNHTLTIQRAREENKRLEIENDLRERRKEKMYSSVSEIPK